MTRRGKIYVLFLAFIAVGVIVDWIVGQDTVPTYSFNDLVQIAGISLFCFLWQNADAKALNFNQTRINKLATILFPPLGIGIYFFRSRRWKPALIGFILFWSGMVLTMVLTLVATDYTIRQF